MRESKVGWSGLTLWDLNPDNNAIKNDYIDNLIYLAFVSSPLLEEISSKSEWFISMSKYLDTENTDGIEAFWNKFRCSGNSVKVLYENLKIDKEFLNKKLIEFLSEQNENPLSIVLFKDYFLILYHSKYKGALIEILYENGKCIDERIIFTL